MWAPSKLSVTIGASRLGWRRRGKWLWKMRRNSRRCPLHWREASDALKFHKCSPNILLGEEGRFLFHKGCNQPLESMCSYTQSLLRHLLRCDENTARCCRRQTARELELIRSRMGHISRVTMRTEARIDDWRGSSYQARDYGRLSMWLGSREQGVLERSSISSSCLNFHCSATFP